MSSVKKREYTARKFSPRKYSDNELDTNFAPVIFKDKRYSERRYTPNDGEGEGNAGYSRLVEESLSGDWSWKPERDRTATIFDLFKTFRGVPPGGAELSHHIVSANGTNLWPGAHYLRSAA